MVNVKVKFTVVQIAKSQSGSRDIVTLFFNLGSRWGGWSRPRPGRETLYTFYRRLGGPQGRSGRVRKMSLPPGFDPRTVQRVSMPARLTDIL